jgi:hypothetical protein
VMLTDLVWLRIGQVGSFCECGNEPLCSNKCWEISSGNSSSAQLHRVSYNSYLSSQKTWLFLGFSN